MTAFNFKRLLLLCLLPLAFFLTACAEDDSGTSSADITISGTFTFNAWTMGDYIAGVFPDGTSAGDTGDIGVAVATGAISADYSVDVPGNSGDVWIFSFQDADGDDEPIFGVEAIACTTVFTVDGDDITKNITMTVGGDTSNCQ